MTKFTQQFFFQLLHEIANSFSIETTSTETFNLFRFHKSLLLDCSTNIPSMLGYRRRLNLKPARNATNLKNHYITTRSFLCQRVISVFLQLETVTVFALSQLPLIVSGW